MFTTVARTCPCSPPREAMVRPILSRFAVAGLTSAALSQVVLIVGLASYCSQPLFAKQPSQIDRSAHEINYNFPSARDGDGAEFARLNFETETNETNVVPAMQASL